MRTFLTLALVWACAIASLAAQETRATLLGVVTDQSTSVIAGAVITIRNLDTNVETSVVTNKAGAYEAPFLVQGSYELRAEAPGFKVHTRSGLTLRLGMRARIDIQMEVGEATTTVDVVGAAPVLNTVDASSAQVMENKMVMNLPTMSNSVILQAGLAVGMQRLAFNNVNLSFTNASSNHRASGAVGGNEWSIDGTPNQGQFRRAAYLPFTDAIQEMRVESMSFDATMGNNSGAFIMMTTKAGTNEYHGALSNTHWQQRWHATGSNDNGLYWGRIRDAELAGDSELARQLRSEPRQPSGRSNTYSGSLGGPVRIPKLYDGRNKLFFFFIYTGQTERFRDLETNRKIYTVPTADERGGDFSRLLALNAARYQIHDPLTTVANPVTGLFERLPFAGNRVPLSRIANPTMYNFYSSVYPLPNNPSIMDQDGNNNLYSDPEVPFDYWAAQNRVDWAPREKDRFFFRWSWNKFANERQDWSYTTFPRLHSEALRRNNIGGTTDWVHTFNAQTILNVNLSYNRYWDNRPLNEVQWAYKPSQVGLPAYMDEKAGDFSTLPSIAFTSYRQISNQRVSLLPSSLGALRVGLTKYINKHSVQMGYDGRIYYTLGGDSGRSYPGYTSGLFRFNNDLMRRTSAQAGVGQLGVEWAAFMLGVPSLSQVDTNDTYYATTPRHSFYIQDSFRLNSKLMMIFGLRMEYEGSIRERFNRGLRDFNPDVELAISSAAQAAYAASPLAERPVADFRVRGGTNYLGLDVPDLLTEPTYRWMPRFSAAYSFNSKTVLRGGYGTFYDSLNASHTHANQFGYNQSTLTNITDEAGASWNYGYFGTPGQNPLTDPFPVRGDGTRFDTPYGNTLGLHSHLGRSYSFIGPNFQPALSHKARVELERQVANNIVIGVSYNWTYVPNLGVTRDLNALPEQFWANGMARDNATQNDLNRNVPNPFHISNFESLRVSNPGVYQQMSTSSFFTARVAPKHRLLRPFPHMAGLVQTQEPIGANKYNALIVRLEQRFAYGLLFNTHYEWSHTMTRDWFPNPFDQTPLWQESTLSRPHRWVANAIYDLPFGHGKRLLSNSRLTKLLVSGWQIGGSMQRQSGAPINFGNVFYYGDNYRDIVLPKSERTQDRWFNTANFETNASRSPTSFHRRVFPNRMNWLRTETLMQVDANLQRNVRFTEAVQAQFRVDLINALNKQVLGAPGTNPLNTNFGRVATFVNTPRLIQITFRMTY